MTKKITQLTAADLPDGAELLEAVQSGANVKATLAAVRGAGLVQLTTGGSPVDISYYPHILEITTGGTAGEEVINLPKPPSVIGGYLNSAMLGARVYVVLKTQTDPADVVRITVGGADGCDVYPTADAYAGNLATILLSWEGSHIGFIWNGYDWMADVQGTGQDLDGTNAPYAPSIVGSPATATDTARGALLWGGADQTGNASGATATVQGGESANGSYKGGNAEVIGGPSANANTGDGGDGVVKGGYSQDTGVKAGDAILEGGPAQHAAGIPGDVILRPGANASSDRGHVFIEHLPTADPHVVNALWISSGALMVSAG